MKPVEHRAEDANADIDRRSFRRGYFLGNAYEAWAAMAAVLAGVAFLIEPDSVQSSTVARQAGALTLLWGLLYAGGGLMVLIGLWLPSPRVELAGLCMFSSAAAIDGVSLLVFRFPVGIRVALLYLSFVAAGAMRGYLVLRLARINPAGRDGPEGG